MHNYLCPSNSWSPTSSLVARCGAHAIKYLATYYVKESIFWVSVARIEIYNLNVIFTF